MYVCLKQSFNNFILSFKTDFTLQLRNIYIIPQLLQKQIVIVLLYNSYRI